MDADSQARQLLDRMAIDFDQMLKRSDISYYVKTGSTQPGNDQIAFFSAVPGYYQPERLQQQRFACRLSGKCRFHFSVL